MLTQRTSELPLPYHSLNAGRGPDQPAGGRSRTPVSPPMARGFMAMLEVHRKRLMMLYRAYKIISLMNSEMRMTMQMK